MRIRRPAIEEPWHEHRQVLCLRIECVLGARELRPGLVDEPLAKLIAYEAQQLRGEVIDRGPDTAAQEHLRRLDGGAFVAKAAVLVLLAAATRTGIVTSGVHVEAVIAVRFKFIAYRRAQQSRCHEASLTG